MKFEKCPAKSENGLGRFVCSLDQTVQNVTSQIKDMKSDIEDQSKEMKEMKSDIEEQSEKISENTGKISDLEHDFDGVEASVDGLKGQLDWQVPHLYLGRVAPVVGQRLRHLEDGFRKGTKKNIRRHILSLLICYN